MGHLKHFSVLLLTCVRSYSSIKYVNENIPDLVDFHLHIRQQLLCQ